MKADGLYVLCVSDWQKNLPVRFCIDGLLAKDDCMSAEAG